ncbi:MAG: hypothetical protein NZM40_07340 [Sphingomonadaceae bacterium]|nr:hypothetical protein [Sphingomonadaceae bacterium]
MRRRAIRTGLRWSALAVVGLVAGPVAPQPPAAPTDLLPDAFDAPPAETRPEPAPDAARTDGAPPPDVKPAPAPPAPAPMPAEAALEDEPEEPPGPVRLAATAGLLSPATRGLDPRSFAGADGRFLAGLLVRLDGPLASRWGQAGIQRLLVSQAWPPPGIHPGDWLAARARALVDLGAAAEAHRMLIRVDPRDFTPRLLAAAAQAALAAGDPVGLCPIATPGRVASADNPAFVLADAWCTALAGDPLAATQLVREVRGRRRPDNLDVQLASRLVSLAGAGREAGNPVWTEVKTLSAWRVGLAGALGLDIPAPLLAAAPPQMRAWRVRHAAVPAAARAALAPEAAGLGVLGRDELVRLLALEAETAPVRGPTKAGQRLAQAAAATNASQLLAALDPLLAAAPAGSAAALGLAMAAGEAAARLRPAANFVDRAPDLVAAMVASGRVTAARAWWPLAQEADPPVRARVWAVLAPLAPDLPAEEDWLADLGRATTPHRAALVAAGLHGLGLEVGPPPAPLRNAWTRAMDAALAGRRAGEALVLAATGLQGRWADVPPDHFRRIVAAFRLAGLEAEARMMVAEAAMRG